jgi:hypothetical protein
MNEIEKLNRGHPRRGHPRTGLRGLRRALRRGPARLALALSLAGHYYEDDLLVTASPVVVTATAVEVAPHPNQLVEGSGYDVAPTIAVIAIDTVAPEQGAMLASTSRLVAGSGQSGRVLNHPEPIAGFSRAGQLVPGSGWVPGPTVATTPTSTPTTFGTPGIVAVVVLAVVVALVLAYLEFRRRRHAPVVGPARPIALPDPGSAPRKAA